MLRFAQMTLNLRIIKLLAPATRVKYIRFKNMFHGASIEHAIRNILKEV